MADCRFVRPRGVSGGPRRRSTKSTEGASSSASPGFPANGKKGGGVALIGHFLLISAPQIARRIRRRNGTAARAASRTWPPYCGEIQKDTRSIAHACSGRGSAWLHGQTLRRVGKPP